MPKKKKFKKTKVIKKVLKKAKIKNKTECTGFRAAITINPEKTIKIENI